MQTQFGGTLINVSTSGRLASKIKRGLEKQVEGFKTRQSLEVDGEEPMTVFVNRKVFGKNGFAVATEAGKTEYGRLQTAVQGFVDFLLKKGIIQEKHAAKIMRNFNQDLSRGTSYVDPALPVMEVRHRHV